MNNEKAKNNPEEFYADLEKKLLDQHTFPTVYMFKFIVPNDEVRVNQVKALFSANAAMTTRMSKNGKYMSFTVKVKVKEVKQVISTYQEAAKISGIVSL